VAGNGPSMATASAVLSGLEPRPCWRHFAALTEIARPSRQEEAVIEHVRAWAAGNGFELRQDAARNLVVRVPATAGRESAPVLVLQGHLDMVCERLPDSRNDPAEGRIVLVRDGDWLTADGTTLGADDGIGIAAMMALAEEESLPHGPLELLMTVNEEVGGPGEGASGLDPSLVSGATLLNLDTEEDGKLTVGSASSTDTSISVEQPREASAAGAVTLSVSVSGGLGGHSGTDIADGRANAIKVLGRALREALAAGRERDVLASARARARVPCRRRDEPFEVWTHRDRPARGMAFQLLPPCTETSRNGQGTTATRSRMLRVPSSLQASAASAAPVTVTLTP
jgi:dipeptidase D